MRLQPSDHRLHCCLPLHPRSQVVKAVVQLLRSPGAGASADRLLAWAQGFLRGRLRAQLHCNTAPLAPGSWSGLALAQLQVLAGVVDVARLSQHAYVAHELAAAREQLRLRRLALLQHPPASIFHLPWGPCRQLLALLDVPCLLRLRLASRAFRQLASPAVRGLLCNHQLLPSSAWEVFPCASILVVDCASADHMSLFLGSLSLRVKELRVQPPSTALSGAALEAAGAAAQQLQQLVAADPRLAGLQCQSLGWAVSNAVAAQLLPAFPSLARLHVVASEPGAPVLPAAQAGQLVQLTVEGVQQLQRVQLPQLGHATRLFQLQLYGVWLPVGDVGRCTSLQRLRLDCTSSSGGSSQAGPTQQLDLAPLQALQLLRQLLLQGVVGRAGSWRALASLPLLEELLLYSIELPDAEATALATAAEEEAEEAEEAEETDNEEAEEAEETDNEEEEAALLPPLAALKQLTLGQWAQLLPGGCLATLLPALVEFKAGEVISSANNLALAFGGHHALSSISVSSWGDDAALGTCWQPSLQHIQRLAELKVPPVLGDAAGMLADQCCCCLGSLDLTFLAPPVDRHVLEDVAVGAVVRGRIGSSVQEVKLHGFCLSLQDVAELLVQLPWLQKLEIQVGMAWDSKWTVRVQLLRLLRDRGGACWQVADSSSSTAWSSTCRAHMYFCCSFGTRRSIELRLAVSRGV